MRKIVFRAREIGTKRWVFGDLEFQRILKNALIHEYRNDGKYKGVVNVENNTVGQFTGLCDNNGKDIYEGDIIRSFDSKGEPIIHYILYDNEEAGFVAVLKGSAKGDFGYGRCYQQWITECEKEVIGNIHDNPEILNRQP